MGVRINEIDLVRFIVTLSVIGIHVSAGYVTSESIAAVWNSSMSFAVPIFIMLSGFGLMASESGKQTNYLIFQKKRLPKIVLPYVFWSVFYFLIYKFYHPTVESLGESFYRLLNGLIYGNTIYHVYFLVILIFLYLLFPLIKLVVIKNPLITFLSSIVLFFLSNIYSTLIFNKLGIFGFYQPLNWLVYLVLGMITYQRYNLIRSIIYRKEIFVMLVWLIVFMFFYQQNNVALLAQFNDLYLKAFYSIVSFFLLIGIGIQTYELNSRFKSIVAYVCKYSFLLYLMHPIVLLHKDIISIEYPDLLIVLDGLKGMTILYIATIVLTLFLAILFSKIPFTWMFGGIKRKQ